MKLRVFVFDDEKNVTEIIKRHLVKQGHEVICAEEPTACKAFQGKECDHEYPCGDILFTDNNMPKMSGLEFIEHMKNRGCKGLIRNKVVMSGGFTEPEIAKAQALGCILVNKPLTFEKIDKLVGQMKKNLLPERILTDLSLLTS